MPRKISISANSTTPVNAPTTLRIADTRRHSLMVFSLLLIPAQSENSAEVSPRTNFSFVPMTKNYKINKSENSANLQVRTCLP